MLLLALEFFVLFCFPVRGIIDDRFNVSDFVLCPAILKANP